MFVEMAEVVKAVGLKGSIKLLPTADWLAPVVESEYLRLRRPDGEVLALKTRHLRSKGGTFVLDVDQIRNRNEADAAVGSIIGFEEEDYDQPSFPRPDRPALFLYLGLKVETVEGLPVGEVEEVWAYGAHPVLRVLRPGDGEVLLPVVDTMVVEMDRETGRLVVDPTPGLLELDQG